MFDVWWPIHAAGGLRVVKTDVINVYAHFLPVHSANDIETGLGQVHQQRTFFPGFWQRLV